jgi:hypothetical protein
MPYLKHSLLAVAALVGFSGTSWAQINYEGRLIGLRVGPDGVGVRAPFVRVGTGPGGVVVQAPFVRVGTGYGGTEVRAPFVRIGTPGPSVTPVMPRAEPAPRALPVQPPDGVPLEIAPPAPPVPLPGGGTPPETRTVTSPPKGKGTQTIYDYVASFKPAAGSQEIVVLHPYTNYPVKVSFTLPEGTPVIRVKGVVRKAIDFNYGTRDVAIWFYRDGRVLVKN